MRRRKCMCRIECRDAHATRTYTHTLPLDTPQHKSVQFDAVPCKSQHMHHPYACVVRILHACSCTYHCTTRARGRTVTRSALEPQLCVFVGLPALPNLQRALIREICAPLLKISLRASCKSCGDVREFADNRRLRRKAMQRLCGGSRNAA